MGGDNAGATADFDLASSMSTDPDESSAIKELRNEFGL